MTHRLPISELEVRALREGSAQKSLEFLLGFLREDFRPGAKKLVAKFQRKALRESCESVRLDSLWFYERDAALAGYGRIAGLDEAGRGPLAGPVIAAAVILPPDCLLPGLDDSKKLSAAKRAELFGLIHEKAVEVGVSQSSVVEIDRLNIYQAARLAMERAVEALASPPDYLLTDAMPLPKFANTAQKPLIHGDSKSASIAAASIIAKVTRDRLMNEFHHKYPQYGFSNHKGYGTEEHLRALKTYGICPEHRLTFGPVSELLAQKASGGAFGYWKEKLNLAQNLLELKQTGHQIKRLALTQLSKVELEDLREMFRNKREKWQNEKV